MKILLNNSFSESVSVVKLFNGSTYLGLTKEIAAVLYEFFLISLTKTYNSFLGAIYFVSNIKYTLILSLPQIKISLFFQEFLLY